MAKLPDDTVLGGPPGLNSGRPIANYDTSAIGKGVAQLGQGMGHLGEGVARYAQAQDDFDLQKRISDFETRRVGLDSGFDQDQDFGTREKRYGEAVTKLRGEVLAGAAPRVAEQFAIRTDPVVARAIERQKDIGFKLSTDAQLATLHTTGNSVIDAATRTDDRETRARLIRDHAAMVDALVRAGHMSQQQAVAYKEQWAGRYALTDGVTRADSDPEGVINDLRAQPGTMGEIANRIIGVESSGNPRLGSKTSSAFGAAQFLASSKGDQTWVGLVKEFRPDLAEGKSVAEIDDMRADPNLSRDMLMKLLDKNKSILEKNNVEASPAALYLTHFLGPKSAIAVMKAAPGAPVSDVLARAVGPDFAKQMIESNMSVLAGRQAGSVAQWAATKMGGADRGAIYGVLRPEQRAQLRNHAEGVLHKQRVEDFTDFNARVKDAEVEASVTGAVQKPLGQWEFISRLGFEQGKKAFDSHSANVQLGRDAATLAELDPEQRQALFAKYQPRPGEPGFADAEKRLEILVSADKRIQKERADDPALFSITRLPAVRDSYQKFQAVMGDGAASLDAKQRAARSYADTALMEQARVGVPATARRIVTTAYIDNLVANLDRPAAVGGPGNVARLIESEAATWGDHWPLVYREMSKKASPIAVVIGSGIKPEAARILADLHAQTTQDILKDEGDSAWKKIFGSSAHASLNAAVRAEMAPFAKSTLGQDGRSGTLEAFNMEITKLAAHYMATGAVGSTDEAAKRAFDNVVGWKYEFRDTWRMPAKKHERAAGVDVNTVAAGAWNASRLVREGNFALQPAYDDMGGLGNDYLQGETARAYGRDGTWVTAPDESGLALTYNGTAVKLRDGKPLVLSWKDLEQIAGESPLRIRGPNERRGGTGEMRRAVREGYGALPTTAPGVAPDGGAP